MDLIKKILYNIFLRAGYRVQRIHTPVRAGTNLNVGSGGQDIQGFINLDFVSDHYYQKGGFDGVNYDMRSDSLPYRDESVDNIYCSHVIEHIETHHVKNFLQDSYRVLKNGGTLRIVCPDSLLLYSALKLEPLYFTWHPLFGSTSDAIYCFIDEVASHRTHQVNFGLSKEIREYGYEELMEELRSGGEFDAKNPGRHINNWDYNRVSSMARDAGFEIVRESKNKASFSPSLQGEDIDLTHPQMSLYIDLIKSKNSSVRLEGLEPPTF